MDEAELKKLLEMVRAGAVPPDEAAGRLRASPCADLGFARVDLHRKARCGFPEVIFCPGKTPEDAGEIAARIAAEGMDLLATRASEAHGAAIRSRVPDAVFDRVSRTVTRKASGKPPEGLVAVICAGTADLPVAEEAAVTAGMIGAKVERFFDVGVAGLHRLMEAIDRIRAANAVVAVAGMEGALPSVVGGLVESPVIAVPTSVGYGANFGGVSALLAMLNSCAAGVCVVNIDNGFGGGYAAGMINRAVCRGAAERDGK